MSKVKVCKFCMTDINKKAKICPNCHKKQGGKLKFVIITFAIFILLIILTIGNNDKNINNNTSINSNTNNDTISQTAETPKESFISIGDIIKNESVEITIKNIEFSYDVLPDDTSSYYTHYPADSGKVYIHIDTDIKNLTKQQMNCDDIMNIIADYNDGFTYNSSAIPEDASTGFTYANITAINPLETLGVRFLIECPQEVDETSNPLFLNLKLKSSDQIYKYTMR